MEKYTSSHGSSGVAAVSQQVDQKIDAFGNLVKGVVDESAQKVEEIRSEAVKMKNRILRQSRVALHHMTATIKAHPLASIGIAFGAGYIVMRILRR